MTFARRNNPDPILCESTAVAGIEICIGDWSATFGPLSFHAAAPKPFLTPAKLWRRSQRVLPELALRKWSGAILTAMRPRKPCHDVFCLALQTLHLREPAG